MAAEVVLARLQYGDQWIKKDTIPLSDERGKYLRLTWPVGTESINVKDISAIYADPFSKENRYWVDLIGKRNFDTEDETTVVYEYKHDAFMEVNALQVQFAQQNTIIKANIKSKAEENQKWRFQSREGSYYKFATNDTVFENPIAQIPSTRDALWRMEIVEGGWENSQNAPSLQLGWIPHEVYFVARGEPPYILAFGNARLPQKYKKYSKGLLDNAIANEKMGIIHHASPDRKIVLGGPEMLVPLPPALPWKKWVLWGILGVGVLVIARMAVILHRQMKVEKEE